MHPLRRKTTDWTNFSRSLVREANHSVPARCSCTDLIRNCLSKEEGVLKART